jgi:DNA-binding response OmpR family regulator
MEQAALMRTKILVVDDNVDLLKLLRLSFKEAGFAVRTAVTGPEGLQKARSLSPDLIVLDLVLPKLDGFAVCEALRKDPATAAIPIVMLTGLTGQLSRVAGLESGANEYVTKPFSPKQLISKVNTLLERARAPAETRWCAAVS